MDEERDPESDLVGISSRFLRVHPPMTPNAGFLGCVVRFGDGSYWKLMKPLSQTRYQQSDPPYEAAQVFACTRLDGPADEQIGREAVVKVKYQVNGTTQSNDFYQRHLEEEQEAARLQDLDDDEEPLERARRYVYRATHPVKVPNEATTNEINALGKFNECNCANAPHLLGAVQDVIRPRVDDEAMIHGYVAFILMTKVPGEHIDQKKYWALSVAERDEIRAAFREALLEVWDCRIVPLDTSLRNITWDKEARKCYIVDFEEHAFLRDTNEWSEDLTEADYKMWGLAEECRPRHLFAEPQ